MSWSLLLWVTAQNNTDLETSLPSHTRSSTTPLSPGACDVPDEPVVARHRAHFDGVGEAPVGRHERRLPAVQGQDGLLGQQVVEPDRPLLLCHQ